MELPRSAKTRKLEYPGRVMRNDKIYEGLLQLILREKIQKAREKVSVDGG